MNKYSRLERDGYKFYSYEYDYDAQREQRKLEEKGYSVKLVKERSDTRGLKMYSIWIREDYHGKESNILLETALKRKGFSKADKVLKVVIEEEHNITIEELLKLLKENNIPLSTKICVVDEWGISPLNYIEYEDDEIILGS